MTDPRSREELERLLRDSPSPVVRKRILRVDGGKASRTGELFVQHETDFETDLGVESVKLFSTASCDFGHFVGGDNEIVGKCEVGGEFLCAHCARTCEKGELCCPRHSIKTKDGIYCSRHLSLFMGRKLARGSGKALAALWKAFWS